jgi:hypothetical protein
MRTSCTGPSPRKRRGSQDDKAVTASALRITRPDSLRALDANWCAGTPCPYEPEATQHPAKNPDHPLRFGEGGGCSPRHIGCIFPDRGRGLSTRPPHRSSFWGVRALAASYWPVLWLLPRSRPRSRRLLEGMQLPFACNTSRVNWFATRAEPCHPECALCAKDLCNLTAPRHLRQSAQVLRPAKRRVSG